MPKDGVKFNSKYSSRQSFDQFKLKTGERARIALIEEEPTLELTHWINDPHSSKPVGSIICVGDYDVVMRDGFDPKCPICRVATPGRDVLFPMAARRFGIHVFRYNTDKQLKPTQPIAGAILVWRFGEDKFQQLVTLGDMYENMSEVDLLVVCDAEQYQKLTIQAYGNQAAAYTRDVDAKARILEQYKTDKVANLSQLIGRRMPEQAMADLVDRMTHGSSGNGGPSSTPEPDELLTDLTQMAAPAGNVNVPADKMGLDDLLAEDE